MFDWILKNRSYCYILVLIVIFVACETKEKEQVVETKEKEQVEPTIEFTEISMPTIVNDVVAGGLFYEEKHIKIRAEIKDYFVADDSNGNITSGSITLQTHHPDVYFYLSNVENPEILGQYKQGGTYTFKLYVYNVDTNYYFHGKPPNRFIHATILE